MKSIKEILFTVIVCSVIMVACQTSDGDTIGNMQSGTGGSMARFTINGDHLYTVDSKTLKVFDLSDSASPNYLNGKDQNLGFGIETIFTKDTLLFIGSQDGMYIYNITRPEFPQQMSMVRHIRSCDPVVASGQYAYVTLNSENTWCGNASNILQIYNISDPNSPKLVNTQQSFVHPRGLGIDKNKLFVCDRGGVKIYDVTDPATPIWTDDLSHIAQASEIDTYDVIPLNGLLLVTGATGLYQFDYTGEKIAYVSKIEIKKESYE